MANNDAIIALALVAGAIVLGVSMSASSSPVSQMKTSPAGRAEIVKHEAIRYVPYRDEKAGGRWTGGIGHLIVAGDGWPRDAAGTPLAVDEAFLLETFERDMANAETAIRRNVRVPLTQGQFDALADWCFQFGETKFRGSTLLQRLNVADYAGAAAELKRWIHDSDGGVIAHLIERRADNERNFLA